MSKSTEWILKQEARISVRKEKLPFVSVIVPVYNDAQALRLCLQSLREQTYPADRFEVIIVDNKSTKDNPQTVVDHFPGWRYSLETKIGSYAARNRGISLARGEAFAFIDSDCIASPHWLEEGVRTLFAHPNCGLVGGYVDVFVKFPEHPTSVELYESVTAFPLREWIQEWNRCATCNMFVWSKVFDTVGLFNESLMSGGDFEWSDRVYNAGLEPIYNEKVCVRHPARRTWRQIIKVHRRVAGGADYLDKLHNGLKRRMSLVRLIYEIFVPPIPFMRESYSDKRLKSRSERLRVIMVFVVLHYVRVLERVRVRLGFAAKRS
jgi:glycosyltransferase involved in cell wall biosynthesis